MQVSAGESDTAARYPVQWVIRPQSDDYHDFRGFAGRVASGTFHVGDEVIAYPAGMKSRITHIHTVGRAAARGGAGAELRHHAGGRD